MYAASIATSATTAVATAAALLATCTTQPALATLTSASTAASLSSRFMPMARWRLWNPKSLALLRRLALQHHQVHWWRPHVLRVPWRPCEVPPGQVHVREGNG